MTTQELIRKEVESLPEDLQREVYDFARFLREKSDAGFNGPRCLFSFSTRSDFEKGQLNVDSFIRPNRLFTVDHSLIAYSAGKIQAAKLDEVRTKIRQLFS